MKRNRDLVHTSTFCVHVVLSIRFFSGSTHYDKSKKQRRKIFNINTNTVIDKTTKYYRVAFID